MQNKLFFEDEYEALNLMVSNSGKSVKELAAFLFPHLKLESAYARLKACLNPEKDERLTFGQIIVAMNFCERYEPIAFACDETQHKRPDRKAPQEEELGLITAINAASLTLEKAMQRLDAMKARGV
jgi:hypothetical protein